MNFPINNSQLNSFFESSKLFMGIFDFNKMQFVFMNQAGLKLLKINNIANYSNHFISNKDIEKIVLFLKKNKVYEDETIFYNAIGEEFWGNIQISIFENKYLFMILADITNQKIAEQHAKDEENRFEALFMHAAIGIIMVNKSSKIVHSNRFADVLFGYEPGELMSKDLNVLIPQNVRERHQKTYENYTNKPQSRAMGVGLDLNGIRKDGTLFPVEISLSHFKSGETPYYISFINDITFKKQAEENLIYKNSEIQKLNENLEREVVSRTHALVETLKTLEKSKKELEIALNKEKELGELKSRFVSMASHEFRTPLTAIQSAASLIEKYEDKTDQERREKHTQRIKAAVGNLTDILEEFLSVGRLEEGKIEIKNTVFDLVELIDDCKIDLKSILKLNQAIEYQHIGSRILKIDKSLLRKIIINLCSNASKFSSDSTSIKLETEITASELKMKVVDHGIGISENDQQHLFDRFFRGKNALNIQGTGLGLHIVSQYVELLKGTISVQSQIDIGTSFQIEIPI